MASIAAQAETRIAADATLAAWHAGRVYDRPLKRSGSRATPEAFNSAGIPRQSIVISDDGATDDPAHDGAALGYLTVYLYGPDNDATREEIRDTIGPAVVSALCGTEDDPTVYTGPNGTGAQLHPGDRLGVRESPEFETAVMDYVRCVATHLWR